MGITYAEIGIENLFQKRRMTVKALVDSGSVFMTVPEHIAVQKREKGPGSNYRELNWINGSKRTNNKSGRQHGYLPMQKSG